MPVACTVCMYVCMYYMICVLLEGAWAHQRQRHLQQLGPGFRSVRGLHPREVGLLLQLRRGLVGHHRRLPLQLAPVAAVLEQVRHDKLGEPAARPPARLYMYL